MKNFFLIFVSLFFISFIGNSQANALTKPTITCVEPTWMDMGKIMFADVDSTGMRIGFQKSQRVFVVTKKNLQYEKITTFLINTQNYSQPVSIIMGNDEILDVKFGTKEEFNKDTLVYLSDNLNALFYIGIDLDEDEVDMHIQLQADSSLKNFNLTFYDRWGIKTETIPDLTKTWYLAPKGEVYWVLTYKNANGEEKRAGGILNNQWQSQ
jgi:hypothetical protein